MYKFLELWPGGYRLYYIDNQFKPGIDTVLLSSFPSLYKANKACDLGCGSGAISLSLLARKNSLSIDCVDINPAACALAARSVKFNGLNSSMNVIMGNIPDVPGMLPAGAYDLVITNPPYFSKNSGRPSESDDINCARREALCDFEDIVRTAAYLLKTGGVFCMIYRLERLTDALCHLRLNSLEPKRLRLIQHKSGMPPRLALIEGKKGAKPGIKPEAPLILYDCDGNETPELKLLHLYKQKG